MTRDINCDNLVSPADSFAFFFYFDRSFNAANIISKILKKDVSMVNVQDEVIEKALRGEL